MDPELERSFDAFLREVGERPSKDWTLDRIDNNKGYIKGNLRWADKQTQRINQPEKTFHIYKGKTIVEWSKLSGVRAGTIAQRIYRGWDYERAIWTIPV